MKDKLRGQLDPIVRKRIGKILAYLLRYGAAKEGLAVNDGDFVDLDELLECSLLKGYAQELLKSVITEDVSFRGVKRFEIKQDALNGQQFVRATFGRRLEEKPFHDNSRVKKLGEICLDAIAMNIKQYDFSDFNDDYLISQLIQRLRSKKMLNNQTLDCILSSSLEILDLEGCYLTPKSLAIVRTRCPGLRILNLRRHGYLMTDSNLRSLLQGLPQLETLNLTCCHNLTGRSLESIRTVCPHLRHLNLFGVPRISDEALLQFLCLAESLSYLDIFDRKFESSLYLETATETARQRGIVLLHRDVKDPEEMLRPLILALLPALLLASSAGRAGRRESCSSHTDCAKCATSQSWLGTSCRWCPIDLACHEPGSLVNKCSSSQEVVDPGKCHEPDNGHYEFDARLSELAAAISGAAYAPEPAPCLANFPPAAQAGGGRLVDVVKGVAACDMLHDECSGFVGRLPDRKLIVLAFRGTTGSSQLLVEGLMGLAMPKEAFPIGGKVQAYFSNGFKALWPQLHEPTLALMRANPDHSLLVTGHSLGGAMAALAAASLAAIDGVTPGRLAFYSLGEPRVGDYFFARAFDRLVPNSWRVVHGNDLIVHLPICSPVMLSSRGVSRLVAPFSCSGHLGFPYHHGTEVFFARTADMLPGSGGHRICTGTPINEDSSCANSSDNWRSCLSPSNLMACVEAHKNYYGIHLGGWWKENQCTGLSFNNDNTRL
uniref:2'-phosphotransferase n=2 Tax=Macrostomum lignano TaxID=282301 RepID=A0A1I8J8S8_9PLAT